jgi:hypothetical protein
VCVCVEGGTRKGTRAAGAGCPPPPLGSGSPGPRPKWRARALAGSPRSANIPLFFFPSRYAGSRRTGLGLCFFSPSFKKKKNAPVQSFLRLPARGSEDNITYVIYMHIKSLAGGCVCREILCEEEGGGVGDGELGRLRAAIHRKVAAVGRKSVRAHGRPATVPSSPRGRVGAGRGGRHPGAGAIAGRLALLGQNGLQCSPRTCP